MLNHENYLSLALEEAVNASELGNFPVGALLVTSSGEVIAKAKNGIYTNKGYLYHAEMQLISLNQGYLWEHEHDVTLYSSVEPCIMCLGATVICRIKHVVWAANDYWAGARQSYNFDSIYLRERYCELVVSPILSLQIQSVKLVANWLKQHRPEILEQVLGEQLQYVDS